MLGPDWNILRLRVPGLRGGGIGLVLAALASCALANAALSKEMGPLQSFGPHGRLFSAGRTDYFLLSRQWYRTEDSSGYEGKVRRIASDKGGGYETKIRYYVARCFTPFDKWTYVAWYDDAQGEPGRRRLVEIRKPDRFPGATKKDSYNLYWAVCRGAFRKFK